MTTEPLSIKDVCILLKAAKKEGVSSLKYRGLELSFGETLETPLVRETRQVVRKLAHLDDDQRKAVEDARRADELALLAIEDPLAYEKVMMSSDSVPILDSDND